MLFVHRRWQADWTDRNVHGLVLLNGGFICALVRFLVYAYRIMFINNISLFACQACACLMVRYNAYVPYRFTEKVIILNSDF